MLNTMDTNLTGVAHPQAAASVVIEQDEGGSMIVISSVCDLRAVPGQAADQPAVTNLMAEYT